MSLEFIPEAYRPGAYAAAHNYGSDASSRRRASSYSVGEFTLVSAWPVAGVRI